jgi:transposase
VQQILRLHHSGVYHPGLPEWVNRVDFAISAIGPLTLQHQTRRLAIYFLVLSVIQAPKLEHRIMCYELSDCEWNVIKPMLPYKQRGIPRVDDRRVLDGIFWVLRSGAPWRDLPEICGSRRTRDGRSQSLRSAQRIPTEHRSVRIRGACAMMLSSTCAMPIVPG